VSRPALGPTQPPVQWIPGVLSPEVKRGRGVMLTTHPHLVPRSWMSRSYTPLPPSASMACRGTALLFTLLCSSFVTFRSESQRIRIMWAQVCKMLGNPGVIIRSERRTTARLCAMLSSRKTVLLSLWRVKFSLVAKSQRRDKTHWPADVFRILQLVQSVIRKK
jgi:hypothetical protein